MSDFTTTALKETDLVRSPGDWDVFELLTSKNCVNRGGFRGSGGNLNGPINTNENLSGLYAFSSIFKETSDV